LGEQATKLENIIYRGWEEYASGHQDAVEDIYPDLMPFCLRVCSKICGRYINENDEEASIARLSILEAFDAYDPEKGKLSIFLGRVIRSRIIDYKRSEKRKFAISLWDLGRNNGIDEVLDDSSIEDIIDEMARKKEIDDLNSILQSFAISFTDLVKVSPRQHRTREKAKEIAWKVASDKKLSTYLLEKKKLPVKMLEEKELVNRKLVDRNRKYIITNALIIIYDFSYLKPYVLLSKGGADHV